VSASSKVYEEYQEVRGMSIKHMTTFKGTELCGVIEFFKSQRAGFGLIAPDEDIQVRALEPFR